MVRCPGWICRHRVDDYMVVCRSIKNSVNVVEVVENFKPAKRTVLLGPQEQRITVLNMLQKLPGESVGGTQQKHKYCTFVVRKRNTGKPSTWRGLRVTQRAA